MLSTSPRDCHDAVAALPRSRKDDSLLLYLAYSEELKYCYGCTRDEVASAVPDSRFIMYETFAPEWTDSSASTASEHTVTDLTVTEVTGRFGATRAGPSETQPAAGVAREAAGLSGKGAGAGGDGAADPHGSGGNGGSGAGVKCYDEPHWLSPDLFGCADLARGGHCVAGLVVDVRAHGGWRGGYPERSCCACGGGSPTEWAARPPLSPPAPARALGGPCTDLPSSLRGGANGERELPWTEPSGLGCDAYASQKWCSAGSISRFAGPAHNNPEVHCCVCGGGTTDPNGLTLPPAEHLGCVELSKNSDELPLALHSARISSLAVLNLGPVGGGRKHRGRASVTLCSDRCVRFDYFAVGPAARGAGTECVCYTLDSRIVPHTRVCDSQDEEENEVHVYAHQPVGKRPLPALALGGSGRGAVSALGRASRAGGWGSERARGPARSRAEPSAAGELPALWHERGAPWLFERARGARANSGKHATPERARLPRARVGEAGWGVRTPLLGAAAVVFLVAAAASTVGVVRSLSGADVREERAAQESNDAAHNGDTHGAALAPRAYQLL